MPSPHHGGCLLAGAVFLLAVGKALVLLVLVILTAIPTAFVAKEFGEMLRNELRKQGRVITGQKAE